MPNAKSCLLTVVLLAAGCAAQPAKNDAATAKAAPDVQCTQEQLTGSKIVRSVCTTKAQRDAQRDNAETVREEMQHPGGTCRPGATC